MKECDDKMQRGWVDDWVEGLGESERPHPCWVLEGKGRFLTHYHGKGKTHTQDDTRDHDGESEVRVLVTFISVMHNRTFLRWHPLEAGASSDAAE